MTGMIKFTKIILQGNKIQHTVFKNEKTPLTCSNSKILNNNQQDVFIQLQVGSNCIHKGMKQ